MENITVASKPFTLDKNFFPGWVRKAVTFTIDDGDIENARKFLAIVRPAGILGTFNLCAPDRLSPEEYREMYRGYEIANHVKCHPRIFEPNEKPAFKDEIFDRENADPAFLYRHSEEENVWWYHASVAKYPERNKWWYRATDPDTYVRLLTETHEELTAVFGEGSIRSFVWPFGRQNDRVKVLAQVEKLGYYGARGAGSPENDPAYPLPKNRMDWRYCSTDGGLLRRMESFAACPDDGELKFFSFGVHSIDYERSGRWGDLQTFADTYGKRPDEFYYATVGDIFDYEDALGMLCVTETGLKNDSGCTLYVKVNGKSVVIFPHTEYRPV